MYLDTAVYKLSNNKIKKKLKKICFLQCYIWIDFRHNS